MSARRSNTDSVATSFPERARGVMLTLAGAPGGRGGGSSGAIKHSVPNVTKNLDVDGRLVPPHFDSVYTRRESPGRRFYGQSGEFAPSTSVILRLESSFPRFTGAHENGRRKLEKERPCKLATRVNESQTGDVSALVRGCFFVLFGEPKE